MQRRIFLWIGLMVLFFSLSLYTPGFAEAQYEVKKGAEESSTLLGKWRSPEERSLFVKVAKGFLGAPYRLGGSSIRGLDCSAFVMKNWSRRVIRLTNSAQLFSFDIL